MLSELSLIHAEVLLYTGKFRPRFIFVLFALSSEGEFKTGLIDLYRKDHIRKLESGRIQDPANQSQVSIGRK